MVRIFAPIFTALALSSAVLAVPMMNARTEHGEPAAAPAASGSSSSAMAEATSTSAAMVHDTTTSAAHGSASTTTAMGHEASTTSAAMHDATTTSAAMHDATSTSTAAAHTTTSSPSYGSGYNNWGTDLNSCVQMCQAKFGMSSASAPPPSTTTAAPPAAGTGATHTVIVAPTKGVLRYVPFAVNASVGDTVRFMWGAGPHTVTKSSALTVCNKSADASSFASGQQNASFVFDQVVNTTEPTFFYCAVPNHCQKGMFGIINPPNAAGAASSVGMMMSTWTSQNPDLAKMQTAVDSATVDTPAYNWASNLDVSSIPTEAHQSIVENIFYTRLFYAANTGASEGASRPDGQPLSIPSDVNTLLSNSAGNPAGASGAPAGGVPSGTPTSTPSSAAVSASPSANGAASVVSSSALIAVVAIISSLFLI